MGQCLRAPAALPEDLGFDFQHPHCGHNNHPIPPVPEDLTLSSGPFGHCTHMVHKHPCRKTTNTQKWKDLKYRQQPPEIQNSQFELDLLAII